VPTAQNVAEDPDTRRRWLRAIGSRDERFDGWFVTCVSSTGIYCRPSCPATTPRAENVDFLPTAAAAQAAGFRACKRCRPDAAPGSPQWDVRADWVGRAVRLIADGVVDREGVPGLARRLGYSPRQLQRGLRTELGAGASALARAQRAQTARVLIEATALPMAGVASAAGFSSLRQFNDTVRAVFDTAPSALRSRSRIADRRTATAAGTAQTIALRLAFRAPLESSNLFGHLAATGVPGVEQWLDGTYRRTLRLPGGVGILQARPPQTGQAWIDARLTLRELRDLGSAVGRTRRLLDLDADPVAVAEVLADDPALGRAHSTAPGRRVPRTVDGDELAVRAVLGQQVSTAAARTHAARLVLAHGEPVADPDGGLTHLFPRAADLVGLDVDALALPRSRRATLLGLVQALAAGDIDLSPGADPTRARAGLLGLPGIGAWTADTVAMRALGDPDVFLSTDLDIRAAARRLGLSEHPRPLAEYAQRWSPWRSYAVQYLWATGEHAVNHLPGTGQAATGQPAIGQGAATGDAA